MFLSRQNIHVTKTFHFFFTMNIKDAKTENDISTLLMLSEMFNYLLPVCNFEIFSSNSNPYTFESNHSIAYLNKEIFVFKVRTRRKP